MKKIFFYIPLLIVLLSSCTNEKIGELYFVGDSLVKGWNVKKYFSEYNTHNDGVNGAHIDYIQSLEGEYVGKNLVVLIGTNDIANMATEDIPDYSERYMKAIDKLNAERLYLLSVPPRTSNGRPGINDDIRMFNSIIEERVKDYDNIVYVWIYDNLCERGEINPKYTSDGLHLNNSGYKQITRIIRNHLVSNMNL